VGVNSVLESADSKNASRMINARSETLFQKPSFKNLVKRNRCLVPATSFFEWQKTDDGKQPLRILLKSKEIFSMAGLYDTWKNPEGELIRSFTIITTGPNDLLQPIHNRMPVILEKGDESVWVNPEIQDVEFLSSILTPYDAEKMKAYPVNPIVGSVKNDVPECIAPLA
jgi:putative SOS response-associated peptidase YedK